MSDKFILITSALPYVNNKLHLGNLIGSGLSADAVARFYRNMGREVLFVGGTDEYGTATEVAARQAGVSPRELCDINYKEHVDICKWFNLSYDCFGRTSSENPGDPEWPQTNITWDIYKKLVNNGFITFKKELCLYCDAIDSFVSDRFVTGQCYICGYENASGDQCDKCTNLVDATKLINPVYKLNSDYKLVVRDTETLYLQLPILEKKLREFISKSSPNWNTNSRITTETLLNTGLIDRSISRDLKWGTPVPDTEKFGNQFMKKVFYVWFDAPIGYISITKHAIGEDYVKWWKNPDNVELIQFMAKDNTQFHSIIFPATLIGTGDPYTLPTKISSIEYLQYGDKKFSKSAGVGVFGADTITLEYPSDYWRYYLLSIRPESQDSKFTWEGFVSSINNNLFANFGNLVSRVLTLSFTAYKKLNVDIITLNGNLTEPHLKCIESINKHVEQYKTCFAKNKILESIKHSYNVSGILNEYISNTEPWKLLKTDNIDTIKTECWFMMYALGTVISMFSPFVPTVCDTVKNMIGLSYSINSELNFNSEFYLIKSKPPQLFKLIDPAVIPGLKQRFGDTNI
jgi:methionyl-tRNA synthetase